MKFIARITWEATNEVRIDAANEDLALEKAMALGLPWRTAIEGDDSRYWINIEPVKESKNAGLSKTLSRQGSRGRRP